jgi:hypothetical protein
MSKPIARTAASLKICLADPTRKDKLTSLVRRLANAVVDGIPGRIGQFEPVWMPGFPFAR